MAVMNLFLDTNIYLNFYKFADDDLEELQKLTVAVKSENTRRSTSPIRCVTSSTAIGRRLSPHH